MSIIHSLAKILARELGDLNPISKAVITFINFLNSDDIPDDVQILNEIRLMRRKMTSSCFSCFGLFKSPAVKQIDNFFEEIKIIKERDIQNNYSLLLLANLTLVDIAKHQNIFTPAICIAAANEFNHKCALSLFGNGTLLSLPDEERIERAKENRDKVSKGLIFKFFGFGSTYLKKLDQFIHIASAIVEDKKPHENNKKI